MASIASERLKEVLQYWQDVCWYEEAVVRAGTGRMPAELPDMPSQLINWRRFENLVFDNSVQELRPADWVVTTDLAETSKGLDSLATFPFEFFEWSRKSRRVYNLPNNLPLVLAQATYPEVRWKDVLWPFSSFVITLETPILVEDIPGVWSDYDTILVARIPHSDLIRIRMLRAPHVSEERRRFPQKTKDRFESLLKRGDDKKIERTLVNAWTKMGERIVSSPGWRSCVIFDGSDTAPNDRVALEPKDFVDRMLPHQLKQLQELGGPEENLWRFEPLSWAAKIAVGWCLYLRTLSVSQVAWGTRKQEVRRRGSRGVTGIITEVDHICTVLGEARLDPSSYGLRETPNQNSGFFKRPHWRRAHDRRPRGTPPTAPKTVEVPPLLIRKDLVPFFGIIGGTKTEVLSED